MAAARQFIWTARSTPVGGNSKRVGGWKKDEQASWVPALAGVRVAGRQNGWRSRHPWRAERASWNLAE